MAQVKRSEFAEKMDIIDRMLKEQGLTSDWVEDGDVDEDVVAKKVAIIKAVGGPAYGKSRSSLMSLYPLTFFEAMHHLIKQSLPQGDNHNGKG